MRKKVMTGALMGLMMTALGAPAWATADPTNDTDQVIIRITPNVDLGVSIATAAYDAGNDGYISLGTVDLYQTTWTVRPATVTIEGNIGSNGANTGQELDVSGAITGGWSFDATPTVGAETGGEVDAMAMYLLFSDTTLSAAPAAAEFSSGSGEFTGPTLRAGGDGGAGGTQFEHVGGGSTNMDDLSATDSRHMWLYFRLPNQSSTGNNQDVTVTLSAVNASS